MKKALVTNILTHYRQPIYDLLIENKFDIYGGIDNPLGLKTIDIKNKSSYFELKNIYIKQILIWQNDIFSVLSKNYDTYILLADIYTLSNWIFIILAKLKGKKVYLWGHGFLGKESIIKKLTRLLFFNIADGMLLYGHNAEHILRSLNYKKPIKVIYNSLDVDKQTEIYNSTDKNSLIMLKSKLFDNNDDVIIYTGRITKTKKIDVLIDAVYNLKNDKKVNLLIVGDGPELDYLKKLAFDKGVSCYFYGACYDEVEISKLFQISDVCVAPGHIGLTGMHSFIYGVPVITHDDFSSQMPEVEVVVDGVTGLFFKKDNVNSLTIQIKKLLNNNSKEDMSANCISVIREKYNAKNQLKIILELVNSNIPNETNN